MRLNEIRDNLGASKPRMRVGRGIGSGKGKTAGRGAKGQKARSGAAMKGFEGGQMPLHRRLPKRGFSNPWTVDLNEMNLGRLQDAIDAGKLNPGSPVTNAALVRAGLCSKIRDGVKILGTGELRTRLTFVVTAVSRSARQEIERVGGSIEIVELHQRFDPYRTGAGSGSVVEPGRASPEPDQPSTSPVGHVGVDAPTATSSPPMAYDGHRVPAVDLNSVITDGLDDPIGMVGDIDLLDRPILYVWASPQELLAFMRSVPPKDKNQREAAIREAARMLADKGEGTGREQDAKRRELLPLAKELVRTVFRDDAAQARQAAYALVANSKAHAGTLNPVASVTQLTHAELKMFSDGLTGLLSELSIPCVSRVRAYRSGANTAGHPLVTVAVTLSRALSFEISGRRFLLRPPQVADPKAVSVSVGCPIAKELVSASNDHPSEPEGILVENRSTFVMPTDLDRDEIPITFATPWSLENRRIAIQVAAPSLDEVNSPLEGPTRPRRRT